MYIQYLLTEQRAARGNPGGQALTRRVVGGEVLLEPIDFAVFESVTMFLLQTSALHRVLSAFGISIGGSFPGMGSRG